MTLHPIQRDQESVSKAGEEIMTLLYASLRRLGIEGFGGGAVAHSLLLFYTTEEEFAEFLVPIFQEQRLWKTMKSVCG